MDAYERAAAVEAGFDPDDPAVGAAFEKVKRVLRAMRAHPQFTHRRSNRRVKSNGIEWQNCQLEQWS